MALVRVGRNAVDTDEVKRIEDQGEKVLVVFKDGDRFELAGDDAAAVRDLIASLPSHVGLPRFAGEYADDAGPGPGNPLAVHPEHREQRG